MLYRITLNCRDSFCKGCIAKLIYKEKFNGKHNEYLIKKSGHIGKDLYTWPEIKIKCPKCLITSEIGNTI